MDEYDVNQQLTLMILDASGRREPLVPRTPSPPPACRGKSAVAEVVSTANLCCGVALRRRSELYPRAAS